MLARRSLLIFLTNMVGALLGLVSLFAIGRWMNPDAYGMFGFALALIGIGTIIAQMGFDSSHMKRISEGRPLEACFGTYRRIKLGLILTFATLAVTSVLVWERTQGFFDSTTLPILLVAIGYYMLLELRNIPTYTFNGLQLAAKTQAMNLVEHMAKAPFIVVAALLFGFLAGNTVPFPGLLESVTRGLGLRAISNSDGATWLALAFAGSMALSAVLGFLLLRGLHMETPRYDAGLARGYREFALPLALFGALAILAAQIDAVMLGYFWSSTDVGFYLTAQRLTSVVLIIPVSVRTLFFPLMSGLAAQGRTEEVNVVATQTQRMMSLIMVLATMFLVLYAREGIHIFLSDRFLGAAPVLRLMALYTLLVGFTVVSSSVVMGFNRPQWVARLGVASVVTNLSLNTIFIPDSILGVPLLGMRAVGAVLATVIAQLVLLVGFLLASRRLTGHVHMDRSIVKHAAAALGSAAILHLLHDTPLLGGVDRVWELGLAGAVGTLLYVVILVGLGELRRKDRDLFLDLVHPGRMADYVRTELRGR